MYFRLEPQKTSSERGDDAAFWLRDDRGQLISFRDPDAAEHFRCMVEESDNYLRASPTFLPATLQAHLCEFDNNGYVIQLTISQSLTPESAVIILSPGSSS